MDLNLIKKFSEKRDGGLRKLAVDAGMSEQNLHRCIRLNKIQAADLEKISALLGVDIRVFFDDQVSRNAVKIGDGSTAAVNVSGTIHGGQNVTTYPADQEIKNLRALLDEKERIIAEKDALLAEKERTIQILLNRK